MKHTYKIGDYVVYLGKLWVVFSIGTGTLCIEHIINGSRRWVNTINVEPQLFDVEEVDNNYNNVYNLDGTPYREQNNDKI